MGGNITEKESEASFLDRVYVAGYRVLDFVLRGALSQRDSRISELEGYVSGLSEEKIRLEGRVIRLNNAHRREKKEWAKRTGRIAAENNRLYSRLNKANTEISRLEERVAEAEGTLVLAQKELSEVKDAYARAQAIIDTNPELEGAMADFEKYCARLGIEGAKFGKNALNMIRRMKSFIKIAYEKAEEARRENVLGRAYVRLSDKRALFVLDEKNRVEAMSPAAEKMVGRDVTGKDAGYISNWLGLTVGYVAPTYEEGFNVTVSSIGDSKDVRLNVNLERYFGQYIGAFVVVEPKPWFQRSSRSDEIYTLVAPRVFDDGSELTNLVNAAVAPDYGRNPIGMDLRATQEISDDVAKRIGGLAQSRYFRNKMKLVVKDSGVYSKLIRFDVPKELIVDVLETGPSTEAVPAPVRIS